MRALIASVAILFLLFPAISSGQKSSKAVQEKEKEKDSETSTLRIEVTAGDAGEAIEGASVYVRYKDERKFAKDRMVEQNWKTNKNGVIRVPNVPRGKVMVQVIASGWKTFGQWFDAKEDEQTIKIRLQKPPRWY